MSRQSYSAGDTVFILITDLCPLDLIVSPCSWNTGCKHILLSAGVINKEQQLSLPVERKKKQHTGLPHQDIKIVHKNQQQQWSTEIFSLSFKGLRISNYGGQRAGVKVAIEKGGNTQKSPIGCFCLGSSAITTLFKGNPSEDLTCPPWRVMSRNAWMLLHSAIQVMDACWDVAGSFVPTLLHLLLLTTDSQARWSKWSLASPSPWEDGCRVSICLLSSFSKVRQIVWVSGRRANVTALLTVAEFTTTNQKRATQSSAKQLVFCNINVSLPTPWVSLAIVILHALSNILSVVSISH